MARHGDRLQHARLEESAVEAMTTKPPAAATTAIATTDSASATTSATSASAATTSATSGATTSTSGTSEQPPQPFTSPQAKAATTAAAAGRGEARGLIPPRPAFAASPGARETVGGVRKPTNKDRTEVSFFLL